MHCQNLWLTLSNVIPDVELHVFHILVHLSSERLLFAPIHYYHHWKTTKKTNGISQIQTGKWSACYDLILWLISDQNESNHSTILCLLTNSNAGYQQKDKHHQKEQSRWRMGQCYFVFPIHYLWKSNEHIIFDRNIWKSFTEQKHVYLFRNVNF